MTSTPILVVLAHPGLATSRVNRALAAAAATVDGVAVRDLYARYPDRVIDVAAEQRAIGSADEIVLQYPTHWYSPPGLLKQWLDEVMVSPWAYGPGVPGALAGKTLRVVTSTGGAADGFRSDGFHGWSYDEILIPLRATARRLGMNWGESRVIHAARDISDEELAGYARRYRDLLQHDRDENGYATMIPARQPQMTGAAR